MAGAAGMGGVRRAVAKDADTALSAIPPRIRPAACRILDTANG
jgi:hypothetical protein